MTKSLRHDLLAIWIALIALTCQMFFGLVHTTTLWVAAAGPVAQVEAGSVAASFLQICSAGGLVTLDGEEDGGAPFDSTKCPVCSAAATAPLLDTTPPVPVLLDKPADCQIVKLETQSSDQRVDMVCLCARSSFSCLTSASVTDLAHLFAMSRRVHAVAHRVCPHRSSL